MNVCDFVVRYDPKTEPINTLSKRIIYSLSLNKIKHKFPSVWFIAGASGSGKSYTAITLQTIMLEMQDILDIHNYINDINVFVPLEYPRKLNALLDKENKRLRKINIFTVHEARNIVSSKLWYSFVTRAISDVNAMSRQIKRICFIIISQSIMDITSDIRRTLDYYCVMKRYANGSRARLFINKMWIDERDLEKPKLRKRRIKGYFVDPSGKYNSIAPKYIELDTPDKELCKHFDNLDTQAKLEITNQKMNQLIKQIEAEVSTEKRKIQDIIFKLL